MKIRFVTILATLFFSGILYGQSVFYDTWHGDINVQGQKLTIVFHISDIHSTMDVPSQGVFELPVKVKCENDYYVEVAMENLGASFSGSMLMGNIVGQFTQYGVSFPLVLKRGDLKYNRPQTPVPPFEYTTEDVVFENTSEGVTLAGTLVTPCDANDSTPVVLMVSGSGLQDRNETLMQHSPFWVIADYFAKNGIATLRYDDRGFGESQGDNSKATSWNYKNDALAGIQFLKNLGRFSRIGVLGHSEGGMISFMLGAESAVDFIISMAGPLLNGAEISLFQQHYLYLAAGIDPVSVEKYCDAAEKVYRYKKESNSLTLALEGKLVIESADSLLRTIAPEAESLVAPLYRNLLELVSLTNPWMLYFLEYEPMSALRNVGCPALVMFGGKDIQVPYKENVEKYGSEISGKPNIEVVLFEECNHLFQRAQTGDVSEYVIIEETISPEVLQKMVKWIKTNN